MNPLRTGWLDAGTCSADNGAARQIELNRRSVVAGGVAALAASGFVGFANAAQALRVVAFAGASNWPFWACQQEGFLRKKIST